MTTYVIIHEYNEELPPGCDSKFVVHYTSDNYCVDPAIEDWHDQRNLPLRLEVENYDADPVSMESWIYPVIISCVFERAEDAAIFEALFPKRTEYPDY